MSASYEEAKIQHIIYVIGMSCQISGGGIFADQPCWARRANTKLKSVGHIAAAEDFLVTHASVRNVIGEYFTNCAIGKPSEEIISKY